MSNVNMCLKGYVREFKIEIIILKVVHSTFQSQTFVLFFKKFLILDGGIYNAQAKDLCTTQTCAFCGPKSNLDRSYIIILMPTVEICLD
jgi:hypothetical protein